MPVCANTNTKIFIFAEELAVLEYKFLDYIFCVLSMSYFYSWQTAFYIHHKWIFYYILTIETYKDIVAIYMNYTCYIMGAQKNFLKCTEVMPCDGRQRITGQTPFLWKNVRWPYNTVVTRVVIRT